jgi:putative ABC transport system ATP-binding protein
MQIDTLAGSVTGLVKIYWTGSGEVHALKGIDAVFPRGSVTAVVGPSGSGKSSLLRILAGLDRPTGGSVTIGGRELSGASQGNLHRIRRRSIGYVFQRPSDNLVSYLTAEEHLVSAARIKGRGSDMGIWELMEKLGLDDRFDHKPSQLSGGEQQRLALGQAVLGSPSIVIADEPTAELDSLSGRRLLDTVVDLASTGIAFVVATHDPQVVDAADSTIHLRHGAVEAESIQERALSVIDAAGRVQLPPDALKLFPSKRAKLEINDGEVKLTPP